jgi:hypothetical protein
LNTPIKIKLKATIEKELETHELETCEFTISTGAPERLVLYEHNINSDICR